MPMLFDWESCTKNFADSTARKRLNRKDAQEATHWIQGYVEFTCNRIFKAQQRQTGQANRHRREPDFDVGDHVVILKQSEVTSCPGDKLSFPII